MTRRVVFQCMECMEGFGTLMMYWSIKAIQDDCAEVWHPSKVCLFQNICHLFHTIMQTFHTLGICFIPKWAFFIPAATFSYHFGIFQNVWYATCLAQYRHSFFSYPWYLFHTQMTLFHTWCKIFIPIWYTNKKTPWSGYEILVFGMKWKHSIKQNKFSQGMKNVPKVWNKSTKVWK